MSLENAVASTELKHLTRQFYSAKALIISQQETIKHYSQKDFETNERRIKALQYSLNSEREMNANLTAELAELESKCERQASCNKELDKTNNELEKDLGLTRLALEQKVNQLLSCESALAERDEKLAELEKELEKKESVILHMLQRDEAHNLEQQAEGIEILLTEGATIEQYSMNGRYRREAEKLRNQAKALRGE